MKLKRNIAISKDGFLFNAERGDSFSVNPIGVDIIEMLQEGSSVKNIIETLIEKYESDEDTIEKDVMDFMRILEKNNLISHE